MSTPLPIPTRRNGLGITPEELRDVFQAILFDLLNVVSIDLVFSHYMCDMHPHHAALIYALMAVGWQQANRRDKAHTPLIKLPGEPNGRVNNTARRFPPGSGVDLKASFFCFSSEGEALYYPNLFAPCRAPQARALRSTSGVGAPIALDL